MRACEQTERVGGSVPFRAEFLDDLARAVARPHAGVGECPAVDEPQMLGGIEILVEPRETFLGDLDGEEMFADLAAFPGEGGVEPGLDPPERPRTLFPDFVQFVAGRRRVARRAAPTRTSSFLPFLGERHGERRIRAGETSPARVITTGDGG